MSKKVNYFIQHYQPVTPTPTPGSGSSGSSPEQDSFTSNPSEYTPILEYVEPIIPSELEQHLQSTTPPPAQITNVPIASTDTTHQMQLPAVNHPTLPMTDVEIEGELKTNIYNAIRWLAEWCIRQLKIEEGTHNEL